MEKEIISFEQTGLFIRSNEVSMRKGETYRGLHSHSAIEIVEVKRGLLSCCVGDEVITAKANDIVLINSSVVHRLYSDNADIIYTNIDINYYEKNSFDDDYISLYNFVSSLKAKPYAVFQSSKQLRDILEKINKKYYETNENSKWYLKAYIYELIAFMHEHEFILPFALLIEEIKKIEPIVRYIESNFKSPITLDDICMFVKYNKYTVCHNFKNVTGSTVFEYINYLRIRHAINKLKEKSLTVLEIATDSGFSSVTYFNRVFKNTIGCSPSEYRKNMNIN